MHKKSLKTFFAVVSVCTIMLTALPVSAEGIMPQLIGNTGLEISPWKTLTPIEGYTEFDEAYYKADENGRSLGYELQFHLSQKDVSMEVGEYFSIPRQCGFYTAEKINTLAYSNSNPSVCSITPEGVVTGLKAGTTDITIVYGDNLAAVTLNLSVTPAGRSTTQKYKSVVKEINNIYKKYGQAGAITSKNFKKAWKEILSVDKKVKNYSQYVDTFYGQDADTKNKMDSGYPEHQAYGHVYYNSLESTLDEIVEGCDYDPTEYLRGWGDEFCSNHLLCVDIWQLETVVQNLGSYLKTINPYDKNNKDAFQIKTIKQDKKTGELVVKLKQRITKTQMYGSFTAPQYVGSPLVWSSLLHANTSLKSMPCIIWVGTERNGWLNVIKEYEGVYECNKDTFRVKPRYEDEKLLSSGNYTIIFGPIHHDFVGDEPWATYREPYPIALRQNMNIK